MEKRGEKLLKLDCVLEEVIFIDIENMGSWKKVEVLKYKAATMEPEKEIFSFKDGASEENKRFKEFIEQYPVIYYDQDNISFKDYGCTNELLNLIELAAILEPYMKSFYLKDILKEISTLEESEKMKKTKQMVIALNCLLSRLWIREENVPLKNRLYEQLKRENIYWIWQKYLISPPLFSTELYNYIKLEGKRESVNKRIDHKALSSYELLLRNEELWSSEGFKYVYRPEQENISKKIRENFQKGERIFIEAPTGSGKSFAYILTAAICSYENSRNKNKEGSNFIISTDTKELQNQLIEKDIPKLLKTLNLHNTVKYGSIKGKKNYLCIERLRKCEKIQGKLVYIFLKRLVENGEYGDIENINYWAYSYFEIEKYLDEVNCDSDECNLGKCNKPCYLRKRYNELPQENITVVNHSLLASWPYEEKREINNVIIDEAHNLMEKAYDFFAEEFNASEIIRLLKLVDEGKPSILFILKKLNANYGYREQVDAISIKNKTVEIQFNINNMFNEIRRLKLKDKEYDFSDEINNCEYEHKAFLNSLREPLQKLKNSIYGLYRVINKNLEDIVGDNKDKSSEYNFINNYIAKLKGAYDTVDKFLSIDRENARIININNEYANFILRNVPLSVGDLINERILNNAKSVAFLSATLRINNSYKSIKEILEQREANEYTVNPVFNIKKRTKVFIAEDIGDYRQKSYVEKGASLIFEISKELSGHMLVLFNNNNRRDAFKRELEKKIAGTDIEIHTSKKAIHLLKDRERKVILLGSKSFFEGIDLPGDSLACVIFDKVPNVNPKDPLFKALKAYRNVNYKEYNYSKVSIRMKQGYGRLVRSIYDYGYFIILDGGNNRYTINSIEKDLNGPNIKNIPSNEIISSIGRDISIWQQENLRMLLKDMKREEIAKNFNGIAKCNSLFWEVSNEKENVLNFKNIKNQVKVTFY